MGSSVDANAIKAAGDLCQTCTAFDFDCFLGRPRMLDEGGTLREPNYLLGSILELSERQTCPFCRLIYRGITRYWPAVPRTERIRIKTARDPLHQDQEFSNSSNDIPVIQYLEVRNDLGAIFEDPDHTLTLDQMNHIPKLTLQLNIYQTQHSIKATYLMSRPLSALIDIEILKSWIERCETWHRDCNRQPNGADIPAGFKLIDVKTRRVVDAPPHPRFIALSYVWGASSSGLYRPTSQNFSDAGISGLQLPEQLPQVINDAIDLVRNLGETYIWIDALCIIQDDESHLKAQLNAMDHIYGCALVTVIAGSGYSSTSHLPGASIIPRPVLPIEEIIRGYSLSLQLPSYIGLLNGVAASPWAARAWTYQEGLLSRRRIIFTNQEIFFLCGTDLWSENCDEPPEGYSRSLQLWYQDPVGHYLQDIFNSRSLQTPVWQFRSYIGLVKEFLSRKLSYNSDGLNAFKGLQRRLQTSTNVDFFWGLPEGSDFHRALLWKIPDPQVSSPLRSDFPSWTWAGWFQSPYYPEVPHITDEGQIDEPAHVRSCGARFWKESEDGVLEEVDTETDISGLYQKPPKKIVAYKNFMIVETMLAKFDIRLEDGATEPHLVSQGKDCGPAHFSRISEKDVKRKLIDTTRDIIILSETLLWLAERDVQGAQFRMHAHKYGGGHYDDLYLASSKIKHRKWSVYNAMVVQWYGDVAECIALCEIRTDVWNNVDQQRRKIRLG